MPTYEYTCTDCGHDLEVFQKFTDDPLTVCPDCKGHLRKVFSAVGVVFKGSGFYATDNRTSGATTASGTSLHDSEAAAHHESGDSSKSSSSAAPTGTGSGASTSAATSDSSSSKSSGSDSSSSSSSSSSAKAKVA
jgi:putative FmdB family regulatory protein